jgi:hypothetical protein
MISSYQRVLVGVASRDELIELYRLLGWIPPIGSGPAASLAALLRTGRAQDAVLKCGVVNDLPVEFH